MQQRNFSEYHWLMMEMLSGGFDACIEFNSWDKAYEYGHRLLQGQRYIMFCEKD